MRERTFDAIHVGVELSLLRAGDAGRGLPARRAGAFLVTGALGAEDGRGNPAAGPARLAAHAVSK
jgi:hypothetical protein